MFTIYYKPQPALEEYVETICIMSHDFTLCNSLSPIHQFMPTHTRFICFNLEDTVKVKKGKGAFETCARSSIIGPHLAPITLDLGKKHLAIVVVFKPTGLYRLLRVPISEIINCNFDASLIIGKEINEVIERLMHAIENETKNQIIQDYLLAKLTKLKPALPFDQAMVKLVKSQGNLPTDFLASLSCLGVRQLERLSLERIGLPPKFFSRMIRFSEAYKYKERNPQASWTEITHRFGYYDQMHLIRDFRHFTGENPSMLKQEDLKHSVKLNSFHK